MNNNIKIEDIKSEPLTTDQKEFLVSGLFSMMSNEDNYFVSKEKYDELQNRIIKLKQELQQKENIIKEVREYIENNSYFKDNVVKTMIFKDYSNGILEILDKGE